MNWQALIDPALSGRLCLTLLHTIWQVAALAGIAWCFERLWRSRSVEVRYVVHVGVLVIALVALPVTYNMLDVTETSSAISASEAARSAPVVDAPAVLTRVNTEASQVVDLPADQPVVPMTEVEHQFPTPAASRMRYSRAASGGAAPRWMQIAPWIIACYAAGVVLMLVRLTIGIISAGRQGAHAVRIEEGPLVEALRSLAGRWSMNVVPVLACAEQVLMPKLVGLVRPTILLPASAVSGLSVEELELILAHELAHVRRRDMWINLLQRLAEAVLFFNPGLWYLTRRISTLREYCCDEMVCRMESDSSAEQRLRYASALLRVTELANPHLAKSADLVALAADGRSPSELRRRVARLLGESVREPLRLSRGGWLTLLGIVTVLFLGPALWTTSAEPIEEKQTTQEEESKPGEFQLTIVGPDGTPVPDAAMDIRSAPDITAEQVLRGEFVKEHRYGCFVTSDQEGRLTILLPEKTKRFSVSINQPGFGPYWAGWESPSVTQSIPARFTAELDAAWSVGGVIVDEAGRPVEGAEVSPSLKYKKRPGDTSQLGVGTRITTDANGQWRYDHVPASKKDVHISVNHPDFAPLRQRVPRDGFGIKLGERPSGRLTLKKGLTIAGIVTDEDGNPIEGALVKTKFLNDLRKTTTDKQGFYELAGCEPRMARVVVSAAGRATDMQEVRVDSDMPPVNFRMKPGGKIRVRVVDENGNGIPKARIFFQEWRGPFDYFEFSHVSQYADENGVWEWDEAPLDEFKADICRPGGMQLSRQPLIAREEEYVFTPPKALVVSGRVIDAKTRKPIKTFKVTPGLRNSNPRIRMNWIPGDSFEATDGKYRVQLKHDYPAHLVRIEADGYQMAISRDIQTNEGNVDVDFELIPAKDIGAQIVTADGEPASEAKVVLGVAGSQIEIKNGTIDLGSTYATVLTADEKGRFSFPARTEAFQLVITHPEGYAWLKSEEGPIPDRIKLTKWARVEGVFRVGKKPQPNIVIHLDATEIHSYGRDVPHISAYDRVTTGKDGSFVFERIVPGHVRLGRDIFLTVDDGARDVTSSINVSATLSAGETTTVSLGGTGRPVVGQLLPPAAYAEKVLWNFALVNARADLKPPPAPNPPKNVANDQNLRKAWWDNWKKTTPEGRAWQAAYHSYQQAMREAPSLTATVDKNGAFRIDDVPPGNYVLRVSFHEHSAGQITSHKFTVPPVGEGHEAEPVELGVLTLEK